MNPGVVDVTEQTRLNDAREAQILWKKWGPYLSERQWGTVREDYSGDGNALLPAAHCLRSQAYGASTGSLKKARCANSRRRVP